MLLLLLLALTVLSPLALYTSRLSVALNSIRKRSLPSVICSRFEPYLAVFLSALLGLLTTLLPHFFFVEARVFPGEITNQVSGFWVVLLGGLRSLGIFLWILMVLFIGYINVVVGP